MVLDSESPFVEAAESEGTEVYVPEVIVDSLETNIFASQSVSDVDPLAVPANSSVSTDEADLVVCRVVDRGKLRRHFPRGRAVPGGRRLLVERFVRTLLVVLLSELVEASLLTGEVAAGRMSRLGFEGSVHPFVSSILLRVGRLDQLRVDAQADPPDRQQGKPAQRRGRVPAFIGSCPPRRA